MINNDSNNPQILFLLGTAYVQIEKTTQGIDYLKKSLLLETNNASAHSNLGNAYKNLNRNDEALASYDKAIQINPNLKSNTLRPEVTR